MQTSLADALFGKTKKAVIGILFSKPEASIHLRELARLAGVTVSMTGKELDGLVSAGLVRSRRDGNRVVFQANRDCPIFDELRGIARKTAGVADVIRSALVGLDIKQAFIFGSVATGKDHADSDVDLMVIGDVDGILLHEVLAPAEERLRRSIHISHYSSAEMSAIMQDKIVSKIYKGPKIMVIGDERH